MDIRLPHHRGEPVGDRQRTGHAGIRQQAEEFLAAVTRDQIAWPPTALDQQLRHLAQALVTLLVAEMVVVRLEMVDIDHQQR